ncbi:oligosaccharyl transferase glycoprotein complex, beta subunit [Mycoemilia scoparia]|uniref:Dolichyl-diphosphooligosaccharide--protein glycosyltransferase subunit WBP1 n=1 Tax=Mycoemilia scoparia TaxID=417184 RepID=A0A9W7ZQ12_9FUNG|nr:oligosaccharyl transferase glycoprotein complex, beta subunit [Mycoemilia scoparia]
MKSINKRFEITTKSATDKSVNLFDYETTRLYDHAILLAPDKSKSFVGNRLSAKDFIEFVNDGGNLVIGASSLASSTSGLGGVYRDLAKQFGVEFEPNGSKVVDHVYNSHRSEGAQKNSKKNKRSASLGEGVLTWPNVLEYPTVLAKTSSSSSESINNRARNWTALPVIYEDGIGHTVDPKRELLMPLLRGNPSTYSYTTTPNEKTKGKPAGKPNDLIVAGRQLVLVSAHQARNNARTVILGSTAMLSDKLVGPNNNPTQSNGNAEFIGEILKWVFQEKSVLKFDGPAFHSKQSDLEEGHQPDHYTEGDHIKYSINISQYVDDQWLPFDIEKDSKLDNDKLQFEAIMLDPYLRVNLERSDKQTTTTATTYSADIRLPDKIGVFTFLSQYHRPGYSFIEDRQIVPIHPFRHDEHDRFLSAAYPYYASALSSALSFIALSAMFLWYKEKNSTAGTVTAGGKLESEKKDDIDDEVVDKVEATSTATKFNNTPASSTTTKSKSKSKSKKKK